jgi:hypothetical protein
MEPHGEPLDASIGRSLKATYRALLARGLEAGEAANLTAFLHGLPSAGFRWTLAEIEAILHRRIRHAAAERRAAVTAAAPSRRATTRSVGSTRSTRSTGSTIHDRRSSRGRSTHVIDPPTA